MKKYLPLIAGMTLSLLIGAGFGQATFASETSISSGLVDLVLDRHCTDVAQELGEDCISNTYSSDHRELKKLAQSDVTPFHNLYLFTYQNVVEAPKDAAIKQLAKVEQGYTQKELEKLIFEDDTSVITQDVKLSAEEVATAYEELEALEAEVAALAASSADDDSGLSEEFLGYIAQANYINSERRRLETNNAIGTQEYLLAEYSTIIESYERELQFQTENKKLAYQAYATEVFFDGNVNNSGNIDILHDLDLINFLLFGEFIVYPDRSEGDEDVELSSEEEIETIFPKIEFVEEEEVILSEESDDEIDPYVCLEDESLRDALEDFDEYVEEVEEEETESSAPSETETETSESDEEETLEKEAIREDFENFVNDLSVSGGDWSRSLPCGEIFCITVDLIKGTWGTTSGDEGAFEETENCIACHLDFIAAATDETLSGGVQPNKVSQNWFEDGTCKDVGDGLNLDFHVYAISVPITLDPSDDTDDLGQEQFESTYQNILEWSYLNNVNATGKTPAQFEQETYLQNLDIEGSPYTIEETLEVLREIEGRKTEELVEILTATDIQVKVETSFNLYNQMMNEFNSMLLYFNNYSDWLKDTYVTADAPLNAIIKKPYCP